MDSDRFQVVLSGFWVDLSRFRADLSGTARIRWGTDKYWAASGFTTPIGLTARRFYLFNGEWWLKLVVKLRRGGGLGSPSPFGCVLRVGWGVLWDEGRCRRSECGILSQLSHGVEYLIQFAPHPGDRLFEVGHSFVFVHLYGAKGVDGRWGCVWGGSSGFGLLGVSGARCGGYELDYGADGVRDRPSWEIFSLCQGDCNSRSPSTERYGRLRNASRRS